MHNKIKLLRDLANIIKSDGEIAPVEKEFLQRIAWSLGLKLDHIDDLFLLKELAPDPGPPPSYKKRIADIYTLALMIRVDGKIKSQELGTIRNIGIEMGLPVEPLNNMMQILFRDHKKFLNETELMEIFNLNNN